MSNHRVRISLIVLLIPMTLFFANTPVQSQSACDPNVPCEISNFDSFIDNQCFSETPVFDEGSCLPITDWNFEGEWEVTAIARESDSRNYLKINDNSILFDTNNCDNWGELKTVNFNTTNLTFIGGGKSKDLDPFCPSGASNANCTDFKVCRLNKDALRSLDYLAFPVMPRKDDFIIGFNDSGSDDDFDDIIILARWISKPATPELGQAVIQKKTFVTPFVTFRLVYDSNGLSEGIECDSCTVETVSSIGNLRFGERGSPGVVVDFPYDTPVSASASPDCTYVRTRSGGVNKICPN